MSQQPSFNQFNPQQQAQFTAQQQQQFYGQIPQQFQQQQQNQQQQQQQQQLNIKQETQQQQNNMRVSPIPIINQTNAYPQQQQVQQQPQSQSQQQQQQYQQQQQQQSQQQQTQLQQQYLQQQQQQSTNSATEDFNKNKFGLAKIDEILNNKSPDIQMFTFGIDLTNFGLNINDSPELYLTFSSPFLDNPSKRINQNYQVPQCYTKPQIPFKNDNFWKYPKDETLFYVFYNQIDEVSQMCAIEELYSRGWQYHRRLQTWFKDLEKISKKQYKCKYFSLNKWGIFEQQNFDVGNEKYFCTLQDFNKTLIKGGAQKAKTQN